MRGEWGRRSDSPRVPNEVGEKRNAARGDASKPTQKRIPNIQTTNPTHGWIDDEIPQPCKARLGYSLPFIFYSRLLQHRNDGIGRGNQSCASSAAHVAVFHGCLNRIDEAIQLIGGLLVESLLKRGQYVIEFVGKAADLSGCERKRGIGEKVR